MRDQTLIVSATYDDSYPEWFERLPEPKVRVSTKEGGHPTKAFIDTYRFDQKKHHSYLFIQDSMEPLVEDVVAPFRSVSEKVISGYRPMVVAWGFFSMKFDTPEQKQRVTKQYTAPVYPPYGIFGPAFFAERKAMEKLDRLNMFPWIPETKMDAMATERAWAVAFYLAGVPMSTLGYMTHEGDRLVPEDKTFRKVFGGRQ